MDTELDDTAGRSRWAWPLAIAAAALILGGVVWLGERPAPASGSPGQAAPISLLAAPTGAVSPTLTVIVLTPTPEDLAVYVSGAVATPGVYRLPAGARADDLLESGATR